MAHGVRTSLPFKVHQALHGYADGHRQLASSIALKPRDTKSMLVLSDISGPGARIEEEGYLTGYPLADSKMYALARTWPALEMTRPGCVWTHTLMLDFADLAELEDPALLLTLFRRPHAEDHEFYTRSAVSAGGRAATGPQSNSNDFAKRLVAALYQEPRRRVIAARPPNLDIESLVLAIWAQQWPRLRRMFRFCTMSASDRPADAGAFDLQILPLHDRGLRARFQNAVDASDISASAEAWLDDATTDLARPDATGLRSFLRSVGGDIEAGREAFLPLTRLHGILGTIENDPRSIAEAIQLLDAVLGAPEAGALRGLVARAALEHGALDDETTFAFVSRSLPLLDPNTISELGAQFGRALWYRRPDTFAGMLGGSDVEKSIANSTLASLSLDELMSGLARVPSLAEPALQGKAEIVTRPEFWSAANGATDTAIDLIAARAELREPALRAAIASGKDSLARRFSRVVDTRAVLAVIEEKYASEAGSGTAVASWLSTAAGNLDAVNDHLSDGLAHSFRFLAALARYVSPDALIDNSGRDPWVSALGGNAVRETDSQTAYLAAFLMSRALGWRSGHPGELARLAFEATYKATAMGTLADDAWRLLEPRLPWGLGWFSSDRLPRLRSAISELFVDRDLPPQLFVHLVRDDALFAQVADSVANSGRGRRYLKRVLRWIDDGSDPSTVNRARTIRSLVD